MLPRLSTLILLMTAATALTASPLRADDLTHAPVAAKKPHVVESPNGDRDDPYYWLRDDSREDPEVLAYLNAENAWFAQYTARYRGLEEKLFDEIKGRIKQDDSTVPARKGDWWYYTRYVEGKEYPVYARRRGFVVRNGVETGRAPRESYDPEATPEIVMLDVNAMAEGHDFFQIGGMDVSPSQKMLAYAQDTVGRRQYEIHFRNLETGETYADAIANVNGALAWASDDRTLFYVLNDPTTLRSYRVMRHVLGTDPKDDVLMYEEKDEAYYTSVHRTTSDAFVVIDLESTESDEQRVLAAGDPGGTFEVFARRRANFHYHASHIATGREGSRWIVRTDWDAPNYRLMQVADDAIGDRAAWKPLVPHSDEVFINDVDLFANYYVIDERSDGLRRLRVVPWGDGKSFYIDSSEPAYTASLGTNEEQATDTLRYDYTSMTTPDSVFEIDMKTGEKRLLKQTPVLGGFDSKDYVTERLWVTASDGAKVPVSLVHRKGFAKDGSGAAAAIRLRRVRPLDGPGVQLVGAVAARSRLRVRDRARPRRRGDGPRLVRARQEAREEEHVHRFHRGDRSAGRAEVRCEGQDLHRRRQRRRPADGRGHEHATGPLSRRGRAGAVRRRRHDDARREHPADDERVRRVG